VADRAPRIVVGVDGSAPADAALEWAVGEATRRSGTLHLVTAWLYPMAYGYPLTASVPDVHRHAQGVVDRAMARVQELEPGLGVTGEAVEESPGPALVAASDGADLLVVGSRGLGGFEELLIGSVSQYCMRHAHCSVVVVR
jgi:nucleotide-binding universal stress UspA family protein